MDVYYFIIIYHQPGISSHKTVLHLRNISSWPAEKRTNQVHGSLKLEGRKQMQRNPAVTSHAWSTIITSLILPSAVLWFCLSPWKTLTKSLQEQPICTLTKQLGNQGEMFRSSKSEGLLLLSLMQKVGLLMLGHRQPSACFHFHRWLLHSTPLQSATCDHRSPAVRVYTLYPVSPSFCPIMHWIRPRVTKVLLWPSFRSTFS